MNISARQKFVLINRKLVAKAEGKISIDQRACLFGDGIFETCRISNGVIYNFTAHRSRINAGLQALKFSAAIENLEKDAYKLIKKNQMCMNEHQRMELYLNGNVEIILGTIDLHSVP